MSVRSEHKKKNFEDKLKQEFSSFAEFKEMIMNVIHDNLTPDAFEDTYHNVGTFNPLSQKEPNEIVKFSADEKYDYVLGLLEEALEVLDEFYKEESQ